MRPFQITVVLFPTIPPDWKKAIVVPVLKPNKSALETGSYRSIARTLVLCKLMERLIANRLRWWMEDNGLYNKFQSGFRRRRSCQDHIMRLADEVHKAINNKQFTLSVMIDLEKAFDRVWHQGLLYKMKQLGLRGNVFKFVEDFLKDRSIKVSVGAAMSSTYVVENETPQGSVLSPLLVIIMINDLPESSNGLKLALTVRCGSPNRTFQPCSETSNGT